MADFDEFLDAVKAGLGDLIAGTLGDFADAAKKRTEAFLEESEADLRKWTQQLEDQELSTKDFEMLVKGKVELGQINLLLEVGAAKVAVDKFRQGLVKLIKDSAAGLVG